jgi:hypothetical protein
MGQGIQDIIKNFILLFDLLFSPLKLYDLSLYVFVKSGILQGDTGLICYSAYQPDIIVRKNISR